MISFVQIAQMLLQGFQDLLVKSRVGKPVLLLDTLIEEHLSPSTRATSRRTSGAAMRHRAGFSFLQKSAMIVAAVLSVLLLKP